MSYQPTSRLSPEEYLAIERQASFRNEYYAGEMFAMTGASRQHNRIVTNIVVGLDNQLRDRPCNVYSRDMRVLIAETGLYTYPDIVVTCGEEQFRDEGDDTLLNPLVIIEVLSSSTEAYDRGKKFEHYQRIESLAEYLLISQGPWRVEQFIKQGNNQWLYSEAHEPDGIVKLRAIGCELALRDVYFKVEPRENPSLR